MQTYEEALKYLDLFTDYEKFGFKDLKEKLNLDRLHKVLSELNNPHHKYQSVHVAGTKGKGSICAFTSNILRQKGYRVGLYTSPHILTTRERIVLNGNMIKEDEFTEVLSRLQKVLPKEPYKEFTFFEIYTLIAMLYFDIKKADFAVFETGLGGRLDATNVVNAEVCGISPISYDHMQFLGDTIEKIAREKSGIIKRDAKCIVSPQREEAFSVIRDKCMKEKASFFLVGKDIRYSIKSSNMEGTHFSVKGILGEYKDCYVNMPGEFQASNAATAIGICEALLGERDSDEKTFEEGIRKTFLSGRMEIISQKPIIMIDGAQNEDSAKNLKYSVEHSFKYDKLILLLGISKDKDIEGVCRHLTTIADEIILTQAFTNRAADPRLIRGYTKNKPTKITGNVKEAIGIALKKASDKDMILATGSFFVIAELKKLLLKS